MNKKIAQAILIVGVLAIWGMIAYRLLKNGEVKADYTLPTHSLVDDKPRKPKETIQLSLNYEDPFLKAGGSIQPVAKTYDETTTRKKIQPVKSSPTKPIPPPSAPIKWPELTFKGIIENKKKGEVLGIISMNGSDRIIKTNDPMGDFIIESIQRDLIEVKHADGETKVYAKK